MKSQYQDNTLVILGGWNPSIKVGVIAELEASINSILEIDFDWEGTGLEKPTMKSLERTTEFMKSLINKVFAEHELAMQWQFPHIYSNEAGYICIVWDCNTKKLIFRIKYNDIVYRQMEVDIKTSPKKINSRTGVLNAKNHLSLWKWVVNAE